MLSMEVLGPSLSEIIKNRKSPFSPRQVLQVAIQLMERLSCIHSRGILHRDLKPSNLVIGIDNNKDVIYMIDFGLSKVFINQNTHTQIPFQDGLRVTGTAPFASLSAHEGHEQSPKDDLECVGYVLVYLAKGSLPWYNSTTKKPANIQQALADIKEKKLSTTIEELCEGVPHPIQNLFLECQRLKYEDVPDYKNLAQLFSFYL
ncbi:unnamed protein product [Orchesella dallaii]|uniref:non-specific serine/threonine protein kinase n=1 Tax=Orchesella dallaii TaxID=48710 RepID=A0ABP1PV44_9HEXA